MIRRTVRILMTIIGFVAGYQLSYGLTTLDAVSGMDLGESTVLGITLLGGAVLGLIFYFIAPMMMERVIQLTKWIERKMRPIPTRDILLGSFGLLLGLLLGYLISIPIYRIPWVGIYLALAVNLFMGYLGIILTFNRKEELLTLMTFLKSGKNEYFAKEDQKNKSTIKVLDTSVIIDGRIYDVCKTGFLEGTMMIPEFVLEELRHIADSSDLLKRNRGRRGLDILNKMQKEDSIDVEIYEGDVDESEVDSKLVKLAKVMSGKVITNDYNLNKVSELQGVPVLNINELANAVKPVVLPGEEMAVKVIKDGKEAGQGVAYLDDGTMIVVDGGKRHIGEKLEVMVTSVLQTAAGRMIFAKPKYQLDKSHA
ncbi:PIN/TRAM domain-containing protein [Natranaerobius thermophilus]|uniref:PilT protein domain protein n=1 Tax=Natranaerobius thermophilus (strain ATCC BAA-1301 / DSM 18059 / JW/NM-WN-LF) TaxID=457570 RepID=B2A4B0_NATTJ|nr:PIN/TRAM domain-containing protein [Natranaerobius thermophilus]ACB83764.1 PilT protein domain protein [Natranaerobius thermophilus JW/NM-WN-LF]